MADVGLGGVGKIIDIALKIKEAVKNVKQNEKDCRDIERCVARVTALIKRLDEVAEAMKEEVMHDALEDLAESLEGALDLVTKCQRKHIVRRFIGAGDMAKELRLVQDDILRKVSIGQFATIVAQLGITLTIIAQGGLSLPSGPQRHQQGVETEEPSHGGHLIIGDARYETDQTNKLATGSGNPLTGLTNFNLYELEFATQNFSEENKIGVGGSAGVFKGLLRNGLVVAVKYFKDSVTDLDGTMLLNALKIGAKLQHESVVKILGFCVHEKVESHWYEGQVVEATETRRFLVTRYLPNGSFEGMVQSGTPRLYWPFYSRIIKEIAQGLHYIHEQNVVHADMKPENILFNSDMSPVIIDFGISLVLDYEDYDTTTELRGTAGYLPPEYLEKGLVSKKYDVFAFGLIILRTISRALFKERFQRIGHVYDESEWDAVLEKGVGKMKKFCDPALVEESELTEVARCLKVGLLCREFHPADRPTMAEVLDMLNGEKEVPARKTKPSIDSSSGGE